MGMRRRLRVGTWLSKFEDMLHSNDILPNLHPQSSSMVDPQLLHEELAYLNMLNLDNAMPHCLRSGAEPLASSHNSATCEEIATAQFTKGLSRNQHIEQWPMMAVTII
jgi:hypothetical protein